MFELVLSREQVRGVDRVAVDEFGMNSLVLMENAGRGCADVLCQEGIRGPVVICCGKGNNAGDGFVIARHLQLRGYSVHVWSWSSLEDLEADAAANCRILRRGGLEPRLLRAGERLPFPEATDWIVDALLGTGVRGAPRPPLDDAIRQLNAYPARRMAVDIPSGLDCDTGEAADPTFRADVTCTFVASKPGFAQPHAAPWLGRVQVLDIGTPPAVLERALRS